MSQQVPERESLMPIDPERHALEARIEHAKEQIVEDLNQASALVRRVATKAGRSLWRVAAALAVGLLAVGMLSFAAFRRRHRIRVTWK